MESRGLVTVFASLDLERFRFCLGLEGYRQGWINYWTNRANARGLALLAT